MSDIFPLGFCGGTLVASKYVISAAHCMKGKTADQMAVRIGDHDLSTDTEPLTLPPKTVNVKALTRVLLSTPDPHIFLRERNPVRVLQL